MKEELQAKKISLVGWLFIFVMFKAFYFRYEKGIDPNTLSANMEWLVFIGGSILQITVGVLFVALISSLWRAYRNQQGSDTGASAKSSFIYIFGMFFLGLFFLTPLLLGPGQQYLLDPWTARTFNFAGYLLLYEGIRKSISRYKFKGQNMSALNPREKAVTQSDQTSVKLIQKSKRVWNLSLSYSQKQVVIGLLSIGVVISLFYWFSFRPYQVKKECSRTAIKSAIDVSPLNIFEIISLPIQSIEGAESEESYRARRNMYDQSLYTSFYTKCLRQHGL